MFACCSDTTAIDPSTVLELRKPTLVHKFLRNLPGPTPTPGPIPVLPLQKVMPPTPDLTPEEIAKIRVNLDNIQAFVKDCWLQQTEIITEVWAKLQYQMNKNKTSTDNSVKKFFEDFFAVGALIDTIAAFIAPPLAPAFAVAAAICGTISALLATNGSEVKAVMGGDDISGYAGDHFQINHAWKRNMDKSIDYFRDNTNDCRDYIFTTSSINKTATLRSLIDNAFTAQGTYYHNWLVLCGRIFKKNLVLPELAKSENQCFDLYFIQDSTSSNVEFGHVHQPSAAPMGYNRSGPGVERRRQLTVQGVGNGVSIWANDEVRHYRKDFEDIVIKGTSDDDLIASWLKATGDFIGKMPSAYIFPWAIDTQTIYTQKYFLIEGFQKMQDDQNKPEYNLGNTNFLNWLFIDDGVGNIVNPDGVAFRYTVFRSRNYGFGDDVFSHASQITNDIIDLGGTPKWQTTCLDYIFGPKDSSEINNKFQVYTGDLLIKNLPFDLQ